VDLKNTLICQSVNLSNLLNNKQMGKSARE